MIHNPSPDEDLKKDRDALMAKRWLRFFKVCRWIGYACVYMLMVDAPAWGWGIVLAIILKRTNIVHLK